MKPWVATQEVTAQPEAMASPTAAAPEHRAAVGEEAARGERQRGDASDRASPAQTMGSPVSADSSFGIAAGLPGEAGGLGERTRAARPAGPDIMI